MPASETELGRELVASWQHSDECIVEWILKLAAFDADQLWALDGFANCVTWLEIKCRMSRTNSYEKVRVSHELSRRPVVRAALVNGRLSYTKAQAITRLDGLNDERDEAFVERAIDLSMRSLEAQVRNWNYFNGQDNRPDGLDDDYGLMRQPGALGGMGRLVLEAPNEDLDRLVALADAYLDFLHHNSPEKVLRLRSEDEAVDKSRNGTDSLADSDLCDQDRAEAIPPRSLSARRLDALFDLLEEVALVNTYKLDPEKAAIGVTVQYEHLLAEKGLATTDLGTTLTGEAARRLACDAAVHRIVVQGASEILDIGRKTRTWPTALRRAIRARHGHRCAVEGCNRRITEIHHLIFWENGGTTSINNGVPVCSYHHHLVHEGGWYITWDPTTSVTRLVGPAGQVLETKAQLWAA